MVMTAVIYLARWGVLSWMLTLVFYDCLLGMSIA